jgi:hypothetical protein
MLINNAVRLGGGPMKYMGGAAAGVIDRSIWGTPGSILNWYAGEGTSLSGSSIANKSAFPDGYSHPYCWVQAIKPGGMACRGIIIGDVDISLTMASGKNASAGLTGAGYINNAALGLIVSLLSGITGGGQITSSSLLAKANAAAGLTGVASLSSGDLEALGNMILELVTEGTVSDASLLAKGFMEADLDVVGATLTTANVADAVWGALAEAGFSYDQIIRIIAAATAGKVSGGPGSPVFRNLSDTTDQIIGTADSSGNRTGVTYGD